MNFEKNAIFLMKIGDLNLELLEQLRDDLETKLEKFDLRVKICQEELSIESSEYNPIREQHDGSSILNRLIDYIEEHQYFRILGIIDKDLFTKGLNFIFGLAMKPSGKMFKYSGAALISITRLREEYYGNPKNEPKFKSRILKEALHEIGHTLGLDHCENMCVMRFSNMLLETDEKPPNYCESCQKEISDFFSDLK